MEIQNQLLYFWKQLAEIEILEDKFADFSPNLSSKIIFLWKDGDV